MNKPVAPFSAFTQRLVPSIEDNIWTLSAGMKENQQVMPDLAKIRAYAKELAGNTSPDSLLKLHFLSYMLLEELQTARDELQRSRGEQSEMISAQIAYLDPDAVA